MPFKNLQLPKTMLLILGSFLVAGGCDEPATEKTTTVPVPVTPDTKRNESSLLSSLELETQIDTSASMTEPDDPLVAEFLGLRGPKPASWLWQPPKRSMRKANYTIPGRNGEEPAELIVTHFPEAKGNTPEANIRRWTAQFRSNGGGPAKADVEEFTVQDMPVVLVELEGEYMGMGGAWHKPNQRMIVCMVKAPAGSVFIKLIGPDETVVINRPQYMELIRGLEQQAN